MSGNRKMIIDHVENIGKTTLGGGGVGVGTYVAAEQTIQAISDTMTLSQAQAIATLIAAICTALYFFGAFVLTAIKIHRECRGKKS